MKKMLRSNLKSSKTAMSLLLFVASLNLAGCGSRINPNMPLATPSTAPTDNYTPPVDNGDSWNDGTDYLNDGRDTYNQPSVARGIPNAQVGTFKVDQGTFNQWQAKGIAVAGGTIYVSASDTKGLSKKGTVIKMNANNGKNWDDLGSSLLGLRHPIDSTVQGIAISGGSLYAIDSNSKLYTIDAQKGKINVANSSGGKDIASGAGSLFVSNGMVSRLDGGGGSGMPINNFSASGGIGADNTGNVYAVAGNIVKKADPSGQVMDLITSDLSGAIDVAIDNRNGDVYVLESSLVKRFNNSGQYVVSFANGATKAVAITLDETGAVYVADEGKDYKDSKVIKFSAADPSQDNGSGNNGMNSGYSYNQSYGQTQGYNSYNTAPAGNSYNSYNAAPAANSYNSYNAAPAGNSYNSYNASNNAGAYNSYNAQAGRDAQYYGYANSGTAAYDTRARR